MNDLNQPNYPPPPPTNNDVNLSVVGTGCGTSCLTGCVNVVILFVLGASMGLEAVKRGLPAIAVFGFLLGSVAHVIVGYMTAKSARENNAPINLHIFIVGGLLILLTILGAVVNPNSRTATAQVDSLSKLSSLVSALLVIPLMFWGASLHKDDINSPR